MTTNKPLSTGIFYALAKRHLNDKQAFIHISYAVVWPHLNDKQAFIHISSCMWTSKLWQMTWMWVCCTEGRIIISNIFFRCFFLYHCFLLPNSDIKKSLLLCCIGLFLFLPCCCSPFLLKEKMYIKQGIEAKIFILKSSLERNRDDNR